MIIFFQKWLRIVMLAPNDGGEDGWEKIHVRLRERFLMYLCRR